MSSQMCERNKNMGVTMKINLNVVAKLEGSKKGERERDTVKQSTKNAS